MSRFTLPRWLAPTVAAGSAGWAGAITAAPLLAHSTWSFASAIAAAAYLAGAVVCHQRAERSFHIGAEQLAVCARCTGLYLGGAVGAVGWVIWRAVRARQRANASEAAIFVRALSVSAVPTVLTVMTAATGWWDPSNLGRALFALPLGVVVGAVLTAVASNDLS